MTRLLIFTCISMLAIAPSQASEILNFYTYHLKPPYYLLKKKNDHKEIKTIYQDYVDLINDQQSKYNIKLVFIPRARLDSELKEGSLDGAIIGVSPTWFKDKNMEQYLWSAPIMLDRDVIVVKSNGYFDYKHPQDLIGKRLSITRGLYYWGVTELIKDNKVKAYITNTDLQNLNMVKLGRSNATIVSAVTVKYFFNGELDRDDFKVLRVPHDKFERRVLFPKNKKEQYQQLKQLFIDNQYHKEWLKKLSKW